MNQDELTLADLESIFPGITDIALTDDEIEVFKQQVASIENPKIRDGATKALDIIKQHGGNLSQASQEILS